MRKIRATWRLFIFGAYTLLRLLNLWLLELVFKKSHARRDFHKMDWAKKVLKMVGIKVKMRGALPHKKVLIAPNHRSFIDIPVVLSHAPVAHLSKYDVQFYPVIGWAAKTIGTVFVKRDNRTSRQESALKLGWLLQSGEAICVHPEGTTVVAPDVLPFRRGMFKIAAQFDIPAVPVAIEYQDPTDGWGEESFFSNYFRVFGRKEIVVHVHAGPPMTDRNGAALAQACEDWVRKECAAIREAEAIRTDEVGSGFD